MMQTLQEDLRAKQEEITSQIRKQVCGCDGAMLGRHHWPVPQLRLRWGSQSRVASDVYSIPECLI